MALPLTDDERLIVRRALGLDVPRKTAPKRNRVAAHLTGPTLPILQDLERRGLMFEDPAEHYGKMRVYRVSIAGATAYGTKLKPELRFEHLATGDTPAAEAA